MSTSLSMMSSWRSLSLKHENSQLATREVQLLDAERYVESLIMIKVEFIEYFLSQFDLKS